MNKYKYSFEQVKIARHLLYWTALIIPISIVTGSLVALFLWLLDVATDITCSVYGLHRTHYSTAFIGEIKNTEQWLPYLSFDFLLLFKVIIPGAAFGMGGYLFAEMSHFIKDNAAKYIHHRWLTPIIGASLVIGINYLLGTFDILGLGIFRLK